jgi:hypothetical protein
LLANESRLAGRIKTSPEALFIQLMAAWEQNGSFLLTSVPLPPDRRQMYKHLKRLGMKPQVITAENGLAMLQFGVLL